LGTSSSSNWDPEVPRLGSIVPRFGNQQFFKLGTRGSKVRKHWFQSGNLWFQLGNTGSKVWKPFICRTGNPWFQDWEFFKLGNPRFQDWEAKVPRFGNR
jgi:hypothetical protein